MSSNKKVLSLKEYQQRKSNDYKRKSNEFEIESTKRRRSDDESSNSSNSDNSINYQTDAMRDYQSTLNSLRDSLIQYGLVKVPTTFTPKPSTSNHPGYFTTKSSSTSYANNIGAKPREISYYSNENKARQLELESNNALLWSNYKSPDFSSSSSFNGSVSPTSSTYSDSSWSIHSSSSAASSSSSTTTKNSSTASKWKAFKASPEFENYYDSATSKKSGSPSVYRSIDKVTSLSENFDRNLAVKELHENKNHKKCSTCGQRFPKTIQGKKDYDQHLDEHFGISRKRKEKVVVSRSWYNLTATEWINNDVPIETKVKTNTQQRPDEAGIKKRTDLVADSTTTHCDLCLEAFDQIFCQTDEVWYCKNSTLDKNGKPIHPTCL